MSGGPDRSIPVVDIFAGPGGLGEGFSRHRIADRRCFRTVLSIENEEAAHKTLTLRAFYRQFDPGDAPPDYFRRMKGEIETSELFANHPRQAEAARREAWRAELGSAAFPIDVVRDRVANALGREKDWLLLGGPPCQASSLAGRSRNRGVKGYRFEADRKTTLYLEYLQLIADFWPAVFVMENVKGLLSARLAGASMFGRICDDLRDPAAAIRRDGRTQRKGTRGSHQNCARGVIRRAECYGTLKVQDVVTMIGVSGEFTGAPRRAAA